MKDATVNVLCTLTSDMFEGEHMSPGSSGCGDHEYSSGGSSICSGSSSSSFSSGSFDSRSSNGKQTAVPKTTPTKTKTPLVNNKTTTPPTTAAVVPRLQIQQERRPLGGGKVVSVPFGAKSVAAATNFTSPGSIAAVF